MATILENERVLATKIAYLGAHGAGKSANLKQIRKLPTAATPDPAAETVLWRPTHMGKFKGELEIHVTLDAVADSENFSRIAQIYDGLVLVVEPTEATLARDLALVAALRATEGTWGTAPAVSRDGATSNVAGGRERTGPSQLPKRRSSSTRARGDASASARKSAMRCAWS